MPDELDPKRLECVRQRGNDFEAACPACRELGQDRTGNHLFVRADGRFGCVAHSGPEGRTHRRRIFELVGRRGGYNQPTPRPPLRALTPQPKQERELVSLNLGGLVMPSIGQLAQIASSRKWPTFAGLEIAAQRGLLLTLGSSGIKGGATAWFLTDSTRYCAQFRHFDGSPTPCGAKAQTVAGSSASWPIGTGNLSTDNRVVLLTEGGPDMLAAFTLGWAAGVSIDVVMLTGARQTIHSEAVKRLAGRRVVIVLQNDASGVEAWTKWAGQLSPVATVRGWKLPAGTKDLADLLAATSASEDPIEALGVLADNCSKLFKSGGAL